MPALGELVEAGDLDELLRAVDGLCEARAWDDLIELAQRCEQAVERGKQLWPVAAHISYRLALEAPGEYAAWALQDPGMGRFAPGPLSEVAASTHTWSELAPYIDVPQVAAYAAQERVLRGEVLDGDERAHGEVLELPLHLEPWEPTYALATFRSNLVEPAEPWQPKRPPVEETARPGRVQEDAELSSALLDLVHPWVAESNGAARAVVVEGDAVAAASALTYGRLFVAPLDLDEALQRMAWAAASGGAHGRRRGAALGRFMAFYVGSVIAALDWPVAPEDLQRGLQDLDWLYWEEERGEEGWVLRLALQQRGEGWAAAISATDLLTADEPQ